LLCPELVSGLRNYRENLTTIAMSCSLEQHMALTLAASKLSVLLSLFGNGSS